MSFWIIDTYARAMADCGLNENLINEVDQFTQAIDSIKREAGVPNLVMSAHTGRASQEEGREHARGGTRIDDWADVRWFYTKDASRGDRYFRADGRDIDRPETLVRFDLDSRALNLGAGNRKDNRLDAEIKRVEAAVAQNPGILTNPLRDTLGMKRERFTLVVRAADERGAIRRETKGSAILHFPGGPTKIKRSRAK